MSSLCRGASPCERVGPTPGTAVIRLAGVLLALSLLLLGSVGTPTRAYAAPNHPIQIDLESLDPALPARDGTITLRGRARNTSTRPIRDAQIVVWYHDRAARNLAGLRSLTALAPEEVSGYQLWVDGAYQDLHTDQDRVWDPGETRGFQLSARVSSMRLAGEGGIHLLGADIVGRADRGSLNTVGQTRVLVPMGAAGAAATNGTTSVVSVVSLSTRPAMVEPGVFSDDHLAAELAPQGRLGHLLESARRTGVSWLVDPALIEETAAMAAGYRIRDDQGERPGTGQGAAAAWLEEFRRLDRSRGYRAPFAIPDVSMLERYDLGTLAQRSAAASRRVAEVSELPLISYTAGGALDPEAVQLAETDQPIALLASTPSSRDPLLAPIGRTPIVNFSAATTAGGPGPDPVGSFVQVRQRMLAESFLTASTTPGLTTVRVVASGEAAMAEALADPPWVRRRTLGDLLTQRPAAWAQELAYSQSQRSAELTEEQAGALRDISKDYREFTGMLVVTETMDVRTDAALLRLASGWWRNDRAGYDRYAAQQRMAAAGLWSRRAVELNAQGSVIMSGTSGSFPMTVTNRLDDPVRVLLEFESFQPQRLSIPTMTVVVPANQGVTVNVQPKAAGNGPVRISAQVTTPEGRAVSKRVWLTVEATNFGRVGWIIIVASGIVLVAATTLRIRQVRRERRTEALAAGPPTHRTPPVVAIDRARRGDKW